MNPTNHRASRSTIQTTEPSVSQTIVWIVERDALWFVGFVSLYAIWRFHLAGWAAAAGSKGRKK